VPARLRPSDPHGNPDSADTGAGAMEAEGGVAFEAMKVAQLKEELAARGSMRTGLKATLQRRLHSLWSVLVPQAALSGSEH
jgi:hypothetical protein